MSSRSQIRQASGEFIRDLYPWTYWITLTYLYSASVYQTERDLKVWLRFVARELARDHVPVAWVIDLQQNGRAHIHVLLALPPKMSPSPIRLLQSQWRYLIKGAGGTKCEIYNPADSAAFYMVRHDAEWEVNIACDRSPRCRRSGCKAAPGPLQLHSAH